MKNWKVYSQEERDLLDKSSEGIPELFGLRGFPGETFRISESSSYINPGGVAMLYTERLVAKKKFVDFAKCTREELLKEIVFLP